MIVIRIYNAKRIPDSSRLTFANPTERPTAMTPGFVMLFISLVLILIALPWVLRGKRTNARACSRQRPLSRP